MFGTRVTTRCVPRPVSNSQRTLRSFSPLDGPYLCVRRADLGRWFVCRLNDGAVGAQSCTLGGCLGLGARVDVKPRVRVHRSVQRKRGRSHLGPANEWRKPEFLYHNERVRILLFVDFEFLVGLLHPACVLYSRKHQLLPELELPELMPVGVQLHERGPEQLSSCAYWVRLHLHQPVGAGRWRSLLPRLWLPQLVRQRQHLHRCERVVRKP